MAIEMEQDVASIIRFVLDTVPGLHPYYWQIPEDFAVPSVFFPREEFTSGGDTLATYALDCELEPVFFGRTDAEAKSNATDALDAICRARRLIPLIDGKGEPTGAGLRMKDPELKKADANAYELILRWTRRRDYYEREYEKMVQADVEYHDHENREEG